MSSFPPPPGTRKNSSREGAAATSVLALAADPALPEFLVVDGAGAAAPIAPEAVPGLEDLDDAPRGGIDLPPVPLDRDADHGRIAAEIDVGPPRVQHQAGGLLHLPREHQILDVPFRTHRV